MGPPAFDAEGCQVPDALEGCDVVLSHELHAEPIGEGQPETDAERPGDVGRTFVDRVAQDGRIHRIMGEPRAGLCEDHGRGGRR